MKPGSLWPLALIGVLGVTVVANGVLLYTANRSNAMAIEPDYYRKAIAWDSVMAQAERNVQLGWQVEGRLETNGRLSLHLRDSEGANLSNAKIAVEGFALAHADNRYQAVLRDADSGRYEVRLALPDGGLQEVRITAERGNERYTAVLRGSPNAGGELSTWR